MIINKSSLSRLGQGAVLAAVLSLSGLAQAQGMGGRGGMAPHGGAEMMSGGHMEHMLDMVDATDAQRAQIKQIMSAARQDLKSQQTGGRNLQEQRMALFTAPNIDAAAIEALRVQVSAQHEVASKRMSQAMVDAARVLTPEQRAKMAERMKKAQARMSERRAEHPQKAGKGQ
jgi:protein CpxP